MFDPMYGDSILQLILWAVGIALAVAGFYWIHRIARDIEDN